MVATERKSNVGSSTFASITASLSIAIGVGFCEAGRSASHLFPSPVFRGDNGIVPRVRVGVEKYQAAVGHLVHRGTY